MGHALTSSVCSWFQFFMELRSRSCEQEEMPTSCSCVHSARQSIFNEQSSSLSDVIRVKILRGSSVRKEHLHKLTPSSLARACREDNPCGPQPLSTNRLTLGSASTNFDVSLHSFKWILLTSSSEGSNFARQSSSYFLQSRTR